MFYKWGIFLIYSCIISSAVFGNHDTNLNMFLASIGLKTPHIIHFAPTALTGISDINAGMKWETLSFTPNVGSFFTYLGLGGILINVLGEEIKKTSSNSSEQPGLKRVK